MRTSGMRAKGRIPAELRLTHISLLFLVVSEKAIARTIIGRLSRREAVSQAIARIQQATGAAGVTILKLVTDPNVPAAVRLRAAECVSGLAVKGIETDDIETRLEELERAAAASTKQKK
jgi:hypothetical protein